MSDKKLKSWDAVPHPASFLKRKLGKEFLRETTFRCLKNSGETTADIFSLAKLVLCVMGQGTSPTVL